jgi:hypothetical protein
VCFDATIAGGVLEVSGCGRDYEDPTLDWERPATPWKSDDPELRFQLGDLAAIAEVWKRLVDCLALDRFLSHVRSEAFWQQLDREATIEVARAFPLLARDRALWAQREAFLGPDYYQGKHSEAFRRCFADTIEKAWLRQTRIGRALALFNDGFASDPMGAFLLMCFALEALCSVEKRENRRGGITGKLKERIPRLIALGPPGTASEDLAVRVKKVFEERGDIAHGAKRIDSVPLDIRRDAVALACSALRGVLSAPKLLLPLYRDSAREAELLQFLNSGRNGSKP